MLGFILSFSLRILRQNLEKFSRELIAEFTCKESNDLKCRSGISALPSSPQSFPYVCACKAFVKHRCNLPVFASGKQSIMNRTVSLSAL